ncbi:MAG: hypothetical protein M3Y89_13210 [Actinomycetota bacterium]|nr:hypothetical protein [Actinomycetota bacterium]
MDFELGELLAQRVVQELHVLFLLHHHLAKLLLHRLDEGFGELQRCVVSFDAPLDLIDRQIRQIAQPVLAATAQEVAVQLAVASARLGIDQPAGSLLPLVASLAEEHALEVMEDHPIALTTGAPGLQHRLHPVKQVAADDRLMTPRQQFAFVRHQSEVIRIAQHGVQLAVTDRLLAPLGGRPGSQAKLPHRLSQPFDG